MREGNQDTGEAGERPAHGRGALVWLHGFSALERHSGHALDPRGQDAASSLDNGSQGVAGGRNYIQSGPRRGRYQ